MRLHVAVVRLDGVNHFRVFLEFFGDVNADGDMRALDLMVNGFADVVQQAGALCQRRIDAQLRRHVAGQMRHFDGMAQNVLPIARPEAETAEDLDELGVNAVNTRFKNGAFAF